MKTYKQSFILLILIPFMLLGKVQASVTEGINAYKSGDYQKAHDLWLPHAALGNATALFNLGQLYRLGQGVEIDPKKAEEYYLRAAYRDHIRAQRNLGVMYYFGRVEQDSVGKDLKKAFFWLDSAAKLGDSRSQYMIGTMYYNGDHVEKDPVKALAWINIASYSGLKDAQKAKETLDNNLSDDQKQKARDLMPDLLSKTSQTASLSLPYTEPTADDQDQSFQLKLAPASSPAKPVEKAAPIENNTNDQSLYRVQLAALTTREGADKAWAIISQKHNNLLNSYEPYVSEVDLGAEKGTMYRLQVSPFDSRDAADVLCNDLKAAGQGCYVVKAN